MLRVAGGELRLAGTPWLMGIVNASPDSFSDGGGLRTLDERVALAAAHVQEGARIIDVGGESGVTNRPAVEAAEEIERVVGLIERIRRELRVVVSVDTYKPAVARAAIAAGAAIVNDISGLLDPALADICAETGAGLVIMHTRAAPKQRLLDRRLDGRVTEDVRTFLAQRMALAVDRGMAREQLMLDPGPDFGKTPAQTVEVLRRLEELHDLGRPLLLAVSRKDFIGAIVGAAPRARGAGTLAALGHGVDAGARVLRVHDVRAAADFLAIRSALRGDVEVDSELRVAEAVRYEQGAALVEPTTARPLPPDPPSRGVLGPR